MSDRRVLWKAVLWVNDRCHLPGFGDARGGAQGELYKSYQQVNIVRGSWFLASFLQRDPLEPLLYDEGERSKLGGRK